MIPDFFTACRFCEKPIFATTSLAGLAFDVESHLHV
jgi:hypothetical protein